MKKWSWGYALLKLYVMLWHYLFYKRVVVLGLDKVPRNTPIAFAPNHQNALMDALAIVSTCKMQPVFLARADIFKNPTIAKILKFMRIMPVYRIRDGKDELSKNDEIFDKSMSILEQKGAIAIFPEANHAGFRHLRALKKGIPRIVFQAEERNNFELGTQIVPVGIYYSNYTNMKSTLIINYGEAFEVAPFNQLYKENPQKGMTALKNEMAKRIKPQIIDIPSMEHYDFYEQWRELVDYSTIEKKGLKHNVQNKFKCDQENIAQLHRIEKNDPARFEQLKDKTANHFKAIKKLGVKDSNFDKAPKSTMYFTILFLGILISIPFHVYGVAAGYLPYYIIHQIVNKKIKDSQFRSSFTYGLGVILYPIWFFLVTGVASIWFDSTLYYWLLFFSLPTFGLFALNNWLCFEKTIEQLKFRKLTNTNSYGVGDLEKLRVQLVKDIEMF